MLMLRLPAGCYRQSNTGLPGIPAPGRSLGYIGYYQRAMHLADPIFIFILAFILLGPKKTSDLTRQVGKLMAEFRKASNDFKYQFNEEMRVADQQEQQRKQEAERAALAAGTPALAADATGVPGEAAPAENSILPPAEEPKVEEAVPYAISAISATTGEEHPVDDHPLLRVDVIPPMDGAPADQTSTTTGVTPAAGEPHDAEALRHG